MGENLNYNAEGSVCYDNEPANCDKYGRLYDWNTAAAACPKGWHLPSKKEWEVLIATVGKSWRLKTVYGWNDYDGESGGGTDAFGFSALPGGKSNFKNDFELIGYYAYWWSSSYYDILNAYYIYIDYSGGDADWSSTDFYYGFYSVRCLQGYDIGFNSISNLITSIVSLFSIIPIIFDAFLYWLRH